MSGPPSPWARSPAGAGVQGDVRLSGPGSLRPAVHQFRRPVVAPASGLAGMLFRLPFLMVAAGGTVPGGRSRTEEPEGNCDGLSVKKPTSGRVGPARWCTGNGRGAEALAQGEGVRLLGLHQAGTGDPGGGPRGRSGAAAGPHHWRLTPSLVPPDSNGNGPFTSDAAVPATDPQSPNLAADVANSVGVRRRIGWALRVVVRQVHRWVSAATGGDPVWALGCSRISRGLVSRTSQRSDQVLADAVNIQGQGEIPQHGHGHW